MSLQGWKNGLLVVGWNMGWVGQRLGLEWPAENCLQDTTSSPSCGWTGVGEAGGRESSVEAVVITRLPFWKVLCDPICTTAKSGEDLYFNFLVVVLLGVDTIPEMIN